MKRWAVIPAAGVGRRMGREIPKQYLPLAGRKVIEHTLGRLLDHPLIDGISVALAPDDDWWRQTDYANHPAVTRVSGGVERCHSVLNALKDLLSRADPADWVLVHDAARPCVRVEDITRLITTLEHHPVGGLLGMRVRDTMKRTTADALISTTVDRENLWHAFTPQMFRLGELHRALTAALSASVALTDEASAMEWAGRNPLMLEGHPDNIKITNPADLMLAEHYLASLRNS